MSGDLVLFLTMLGLALSLRHSSIPLDMPANSPVAGGAILGTLCLVVLYFEDLYAPDRSLTPYEVIGRLARASVELVVVVAVGSTLIAHVRAPTTVLPGIALAMATLIVWRLLVDRVFHTRPITRVAILGGGEHGAALAGEIAARKHLGYELLAVIGPSNDGPSPAVSQRTSYLRDKSLDYVVRNGRLNCLVLGDYDPGMLDARALLDWRLHGIEIVDFESFFERVTGRLALPFARTSWLAFAPGFRRSRGSETIKRLIDIVVAATVLILTLPLLLLTMIAIRLESAGPVLFTQDRIGLSGKLFKVRKLRSMQYLPDAETVLTAKRDPRITRVGSIIRKLRIDELPQLYNVLVGDMSIVGPRPIPASLAERCRRDIPFWDYRHAVKPGLTGWAQICFSYTDTLDGEGRKLGYDLYYIKNWSLLFDLQILVQSFKVVLFGRGAR